MNLLTRRIPTLPNSRTMKAVEDGDLHPSTGLFIAMIQCAREIAVVTGKPVDRLTPMDVHDWLTQNMPNKNPFTPTLYKQ